MNQKVFSDMCLCIRKAWTPKDGVVVRMIRGGRGDSPELMLCVGGHRNQGFVARDCIVWEGDDMVYEGSIQSSRLRCLLTHHKVCLLEFTNVKLMEHEKQGMLKCAKDPSLCKRHCCLSTAKAHEEENAEPIAIRGAEEAVQDGGNRQ